MKTAALALFATISPLLGLLWLLVNCLVLFLLWLAYGRRKK